MAVMLGVVSCFVLTVLTTNCPFVRCYPVEVGDESGNQCNSSILVNIKSGLPTDQFFVDGVSVVKKPGESFSISTGSRILSVKLNNKPGQLRSLVQKVVPAVAKLRCTVTLPAGQPQVWTSIGYDDVDWPIQLTKEQDDTWWQTDKYTVALKLLETPTRDIFCRAHLKCYMLSPSDKTTSKTSITTSIAVTTTATTTAAPTPSSTAGTTPVLQDSYGGGLMQGGQSTILYCIYANNPSPTGVTWYLNGTALNSSNTALQQAPDGTWVASFTIQAVGVDTAGQYTCVATNGFGLTSGPNITVTVNYRLYSVLPVAHQLSGVLPQTILLQVQQGCDQVFLQLRPTNDTAVSDDPLQYNLMIFDRTINGVLVNLAMSSSWPPECNTYYAWIWISVASDKSISVGVGPIPGENLQASDVSFNTGDNYLWLSSLDTGTTLTYYVYRPIVA